MRLLIASVVLSALLAVPAGAQPAPSSTDDFKPSVGQAGKDVIWVPTPDALVTAMLKAAKTTRDDLVYDLGAGDGKIAIAAAKEFGARAVGIEYDPKMADFARANVLRAGVADKVTIVTGDIFVEDFSKATVVTLYLLPQLNIKLRPQILAMKPGTRVVSHQFHMGEWEPDETLKVEFRDAYLWIVPANVAGTWSLRETRGNVEASVNIVQQFQRIGGTSTAGGKTQPLLGPVVAGNAVEFTFAAADGRLQRARATVDGDTMTGDLLWSGTSSQFVARRVKAP
jgi:SAM-dependent methyltransferase